jgi:hypothetical protein
MGLPGLVPSGFAVDSDDRESPSAVAGVASRATRATTNLGLFRFGVFGCGRSRLIDLGRGQSCLFVFWSRSPYMEQGWES